MVVDWRARISRAFYRASRAEPMGVELRRRFGFQHGELTAYEDEALLEAGARGRPTSTARSSRPRSSGLASARCATSSRPSSRSRTSSCASDLDESVCVQGAPGTGKTAVGLHRAAFLLYAHRDQLSRQGVLVVGPNASFLRYIGDVLPALGEIDAQQTTIEELAAKTMARLDPRYVIRGVDDPAVATLKGDARLATVVRRAVWSQVRSPSERLLVPRGRATLAPRAVRGGGGARRAAVARGALRRRARHARAAARPPDPGEDGGRGRVARRPGAGRGGAQPRGQEVRRRGCGRPSTRRGWCCGCSETRTSSRRWPTACSPTRSRRRCAGRSPRSRRGSARVVAGRRGAGRRGGRPRGAHPVAGARGRRRGAGPVADDAARGGAPVLDGLGDRARRPGAGDHTVGEQVVARRARAPRQGRRAHRAADPRLPGARRGHRLRGQAAAGDRAGPRAADVGAAHPWRARVHGGPARELADRVGEVAEATLAQGRVRRADRPRRARAARARGS